MDNNNIKPFDKYDLFINNTLINIYTLSKDKDTIILKNFNRKNTLHLYFMTVSNLASRFFHKNIVLNTNIFSYILIKIQHYHIAKSMKRTSNLNNENASVIDIDEVLRFMIGEMELTPDFLDELYKAYYKKGK